MCTVCLCICVFVSIQHWTSDPLFHPCICGKLPQARIIYHTTPVGMNLIPGDNGLEFKEENADRKLFQRLYFMSNLR